jgi:fused signal recognition particle receptor
LSFFNKIKSGLGLTNTQVFSKIGQLLGVGKKISDELLDEIEEILIGGDIGVKTTNQIIERLKSAVKKNNFSNSEELFELLKSEIKRIVEGSKKASYEMPNSPHVIMVIGVNGVGKTTSIGKLTKRLLEEGKSVLLVAADTFRAAAIDQLSIWADRNQVDIVKHKEGADPSAVAFDGVSAGVARTVDVIIIDTAGRLHNKKNLMDQLAKMDRVIKKVIPEAPHETLLVLDSTMGQNAINQAKAFSELSPVDGIILTKLDGTAKGGVVIGIGNELNIPVKYIGVGEGIDDLNKFEPAAFIEGIFS